MSGLDLKKEWKTLYNPSAKEPALVDVPPMRYLMVDGAGDPNTSVEYHVAMQVLYAAAYTLKFLLKKAAAAQDFVVSPLEGLWWSTDMEHFSLEQRGDWRWTSLIAVPEFVEPAHLAMTLDEVRRKKGELPGLDKLRLEVLHEGRCAQIMHLGPYAAEAPTIAGLHAFIDAQGYRRRGRHHEIYLSDPRRTEPARMRTVIRQPVSAVR